MLHIPLKVLGHFSSNLKEFLHKLSHPIQHSEAFRLSAKLCSVTQACCNHIPFVCRIQNVIMISQEQVKIENIRKNLAQPTRYRENVDRNFIHDGELNSMLTVSPQVFSNWNFLSKICCFFFPYIYLTGFGAIFSFERGSPGNQSSKMVFSGFQVLGED